MFGKVFEFMNAKREVDKLIEQASSANNPSPRIFVELPIYVELMEELLPEYKKRYGAMVCDWKTLEEGYENILYSGCAICLKI